jgi:hypothetical protein
MDRAAVGLGAVFLHLRSELNYHRLFEAQIDTVNLEGLAAAVLARLDAVRHRADPVL